MFDHYVYDFTFYNLLMINLQEPKTYFPPISDNKYFSYSFRFLICIFDAFNCIASNYLSPGAISGLLFVLFPIRDISFSLTVKMSFLTNFPNLDNFFGSSQFFESCDSLSFCQFFPLSY